MVFPKILRKERLCKVCHKERGSEESVWRKERKSGSLLEGGVATSLEGN